MKLLSLNVWGGTDFAPLMDYLQKQIASADIFCFQEVFDNNEHVSVTHGARANLWEELSNLFLDFHKFYYPAFKNFDVHKKVDFKLTSGLGMFIKRDINISSEGDYFTYRQRFAPLAKDIHDTPVNLQYAIFNKDGRQYLICNFHGLWYPGDKLDTKDRIRQSEKILKFLDNQTGAKIICGDFNLMPQTKSVGLLDAKLRDLIKEFNINTTRSSLSPFYGKKGEQKFADYTFVSKDIKVVGFQVPHVAVSDHLPMVLEFN
ncbi:endonuclease/exonuclease/phosphatase family protein [Candidatus Daviesbacteria bacterium]|nr:endonuclease/exonuclease/phosphatase family protein [Candidatus Daviesbacteria bacterium]